VTIAASVGVPNRGRSPAKPCPRVTPAQTPRHLLSFGEMMPAKISGYFVSSGLASVGALRVIIAIHNSAQRHNPCISRPWPSSFNPLDPFVWLGASVSPTDALTLEAHDLTRSFHLPRPHTFGISRTSPAVRYGSFRGEIGIDAITVHALVHRFLKKKKPWIDASGNCWGKSRSHSRHAAILRLDER